jgi:hypothetical protein
MHGNYNINIIQEGMVGMKKRKERIDKEAMKKAYVEMGKINSTISEEFNVTELKSYLEMEVRLSD